MSDFTPKAVIYPSGGKHEILVSGEVPDQDGDDTPEARNVTITNQELAARYRAAIKEHNLTIKAAHELLAETVKATDEALAKARKELDPIAFSIATEKFDADNKPKAEDE